MKLSQDEVLARVHRLPPLPQVVHELRAALADDSTGPDRIAAIVAGEPALTLAALRIANSPFYGVSGRVTTTRDAVQILGMSTFTSAVTTAAIVAGLGRGSCPGFDVVSSWRHAVATALSAQMMARSRGHDAEAAYVGGLLHDVGRLVLAAHFPAPFSATLAHVTSHGEAPLDVERELLGLDHAEVGAMVAAHWRLPTRLVEAIAHHHELDGGDDRGLLDLLHVADNVTYALGVSGSADEIVPPLSSDAWTRVGLVGSDLPQLFAEIEARMQGLGVAH